METELRAQKLTLTHVIKWCLTRVPRLFNGEKSFQQVVLEKVDIYMQKNQLGPLPNTVYKT